jgi:ADP-heptose:LPS heptosyltransferase
LLADVPSGARLVAITPGGYRPAEKRWPCEYFVELSAKILRRGWQIVLLGSENERALGEQIASDVRSRSHRLAHGIHVLSGRTRPEHLVYLLSQVDLHVANDTGVAHLAGALNLPQVVLYLGHGTSHETLGLRDVRLFSCSTSMTTISTDEVLASVMPLLEAAPRLEPTFRGAVPERVVT